MLMLCSIEAKADIEISGIDGELLANVEAYLSLDQLDCSASSEQVVREYRDLEDQTADALVAFGYYAPQVTTDLDMAGECWTAVMTIEPGRRTTIRSFDFSIDGASDDEAFTEVRESPGLAVGDGLHHGRYEQLKRRLLDLARDRGYPEAGFDVNRLDVYPEEFAADIELRFVTGPRYAFGELMIEQEALAEDFVARYIDVMPGEPFDNAVLTESYLALADSGFFETIDVRALEPDPATRTIPVRVALTGTPRLRITYGVGFSTDTGPRLRLSRAIHRFNDRGHELTIDSQLSPVISEVSANYRFPYGDPRFEWASFDGGIKREETDTSTSRGMEFGARRVLERRGGWSRTQFVDLLVEDFEVAAQSGRSRLLMPGINWTRIRGDDPLRPTRGGKVDIEIRGAGDALGSDTSFVQTVVDYKVIRSFGSRSRILVRATAGATFEDRFEDLPPSVRFFAGGDSSIRGYDFESLGPVDANGEVIGGSKLLVGSFEYEVEVRPRWSIALFVDAGNAFAGSRIDRKTGAGIGTRWQSPLGPVRLDIGFPVGDSLADTQIHISLGPDL